MQQIQGVVEKCVSRIIDPRGTLVQHLALLLASLLRCPPTLHLPGSTLGQLVAWLGEALRHQGGQPDTVYQLLRALAATLKNTPNPAQEVSCRTYVYVCVCVCVCVRKRERERALISYKILLANLSLPFFETSNGD